MEMKEYMEKLDVEMKRVEGIIADGLTKQEKGLEGTAQTISQVKDAMAKAEEKYEALELEKKDLEKRLSEVEVKFNRPAFSTGGGEIMATAGQQFILSDNYQTARDRKSKEVEAVEMKSLFETKQIPGATRGDLDADRSPVWAQRDPELVYQPGQRDIRLFDLMQVSPCSSNSIEYYEEVLSDDYDGPGSQDHETHEKPQMSINFEKKTAVIETISAWLPASRQVLEDAPQLQSYIDGRLRYFIMAEAERQLLYGNGMNGQLLGIINTPNIGNSTVAASDTTIDAVRKSIAKIRSSEYQATGIVMHPNDWADIELQKGNDMHYIWVQVPNGGEMRLWRVPVIETSVINENQILVGAFGLGAKLWDRQQASIRVSEHHEDFFIRNAVAILAEMRLGLAVYRPPAFDLITTGEVSS